MINLSIKERMLLEDEKSHEQLCVDKYNEYSNKAYSKFEYSSIICSGYKFFSR